MIRASQIADSVDAAAFFKEVLEAATTKSVDEILSRLPIVDDEAYTFSSKAPEVGWVEGKFHWYPVGGERGNAGRIKLAGAPENPIAERTVNSMEGLIELERQKELLEDPSAAAPTSPRDAVKRYFKLPPLDELPNWPTEIEGMRANKYAREIARQIRVRLLRSTRPTQYTVAIEDEGIGQAPLAMHETLLSLGSSDKGDKPYLIGVFGQGGSSAYQASTYSSVVSRRAPQLRSATEDGDVGWTIVKHVFPKGRRDDYFAYLAAHPDGRVPMIAGSAADAMGFLQGTRISHIDYDFGKTEPARTLYQSLNHLIFNPVLPYELITRRDRGPDPMWGNAYRLSKLKPVAKALDKTFEPQGVTKSQEKP